MRCFRGGLTLSVLKIPFRVFSSLKLPRFDGHGNSNEKRESRWKRKGSTLSIDVDHLRAPTSISRASSGCGFCFFQLTNETGGSGGRLRSNNGTPLPAEKLGQLDF